MELEDDCTHLVLDLTGQIITYIKDVNNVQNLSLPTGVYLTRSNCKNNDNATKRIFISN